MVNTPVDDDAFDEESPAFKFESLQQARQRLNLPLDIDEVSKRGVAAEDLLWILDRFPFVQLTDGYEKAEPLIKQALEIDQKEYGIDHPETARALNNLGWLYNELGEYEKAET